MSSEAAELSSLSTAVEDLSRRVTAIADRRTTDDPDETTSALFEVERALQLARRHLDKAVKLLRR